MQKIILIGILFLSILAHAEVEAPNLPKITLGVGGVHKVIAEVASIPSDRAQGLMFRKKMSDNEGMLFVYPQPHITGMWMKNTLIPLSVAFIDDKGVIINVEEMKPQTLDAHMAKKPAKYSLEMNSGWFKKRKLGPGVKIKGLENAPEPQ
jgi:uncharacterized protein